MGLGRCLCAATTQSCSGTEAAGQGESWWRSASASPLPCAPSLEAPAAIASTTRAQFSAGNGGDSPQGSVHPSAPPLPAADDAGSDHGGIGNSVTTSRATGNSDGVPHEEGPRHALAQGAGVPMTGPELSGFNTDEVVSKEVPGRCNASSPVLGEAPPLSLTDKGIVSTAVYAKNLEMKVEELEDTKKDLEVELRAMRLEVQKGQGRSTEEEQRDPVVLDLKQQLERAEAARAKAESNLTELRRTQKAVGQPTECVTLQGRRFTAEEVFSELEMRNKQIEDLEAKAAVHASELTHAHLERDWAKDEQRRAEEALAQSKTRKVNGQNYTHEEACWELERALSQVKVLVASNEAYSAAERSENDVWQIALKDMSAQLQVTSSERAACQTAMLRLQDSLGEQTRVHAEAVKELQAQVETIDAERTCIELELTQVKAERDTLAKKLASAQTTCKELSDQWEKLAGTGKSATVMDSQGQPQDINQRLKCAENQVERLSSCLANEQIARDLVTKQLVAATNEQKSLQQKVKTQERELSRLHSELGSSQSRNTASNRHKENPNTATPRASVQRDAQDDKEQTALKVPPNKVPELGSPDVAALLVPFRDRLLAFEAKHRKAGTAASQAGTACCTPQQKEERQRGAAEALVRALQVSREAYADALRAQQEDNGEHGSALGDVGNVFRNKGRSGSEASLQSLGKRSAAERGVKAPAGSKREGSVAGGRGKGSTRSLTGSEHDSVSEELAKLIKETEQQKASDAADAAALGSNATRMNEYLQKLKKDLDDCLKDSDSVEDDAPHSARSSSTGILSEAPMVRHEKAKLRNQRMAEKHKHIIESIQGVISLVVASAKLKAQDHTQQKEPVQKAEAADTQNVSASANNYDVFCMLEDALDPSLAGGQSLRASVAPSHVSSTNGPFKMNSWKMQTESKPLIDLNMSRESGAAGRSMNRANTFSTATRKPSLPVLNALSLPVDREKPRSERFALEEVREEHTESFKSLYPHKASSTGKVATPVASTPPAAEKPTTAPRRWSMLRMFTTGKKSDSAASPGVTAPARGANRSAGGNSFGPPQHSQPMDSGHTIMRGHQPQPSAPAYPQHNSMRSGSNLQEPRSSYSTQQHPSSGHYAGYAGGAEPYQYNTPDATPQWYTPAASSATPSYITPIARNSTMSMNAGQSRDVLRAAQQATPEQARAVLQKFQSIRSRQRAQSSLAPGH